MDFVPLSDVFYRLVGYHAFHEFAERPEGITVDDIEAVASYCAKLASHQERLRIQKKRIASGRRVSAPTNQNWPDCPDIVRHFLNMLVIRGKSIDASRRRARRAGRWRPKRPAAGKSDLFTQCDLCLG